MADRPTSVRYIVLLGLCLAAGLAYVHRGTWGIVESTVRSDLDLSTVQTGRAMAAFFWAYALFQIPTGLLVDAWGPRRALLLFGLLGAVTMAISAASLQFDAATGFAVLFVARILMGIAQAGLFPASTRAISNWFPVQRRGFATGTLQACMSAGGAVGAYITARLLGIVDWPMIFLIYAVPGVVWSFWYFAWFRDRPELHGGTNVAERTLLKDAYTVTPRPAGTSAFAPFMRLPIILLCIQQFFRAAPNVFWMTWCSTYLQNVHSLDPQKAGQITSLPTFGVVAGSLAGGLLADWVLKRTGSKRLSRSGVAIGTTLVGVACFGLAYIVPPGQLGLAMTFLIAGALFTSGGNPSSYSVAMDLGGRNLAAVFGAMNMAGNFGAALFSRIVPDWVDEFGWPSVVLLVAGSYLVAAVCWLPLNPNAPERASY